MLETIVLAVDGSPHAKWAAELVCQLAKDGGNKVLVLQVIEVMPMRGGVTVELDQDRDGVEAAGRYARQLELAGVPTKVELIRTLSGHVGRLIVATARDHQAGMIVLGSRGRSDLTAFCSAAWPTRSSIWPTPGPGRPLTAHPGGRAQHESVVGHTAGE